MTNPQEQQRRIGKIIARAWSDDSFKKQLLADPAAALKAGGVDVPDSVTVRAVENTATIWHLVVPPKPKGVLSDEDLEQIAGGGFFEKKFACEGGV